jgi:hypothetical protein
MMFSSKVLRVTFIALSVVLASLLTIVFDQNVLAETQKETGIRLVNEFEDKCKTYKLTSRGSGDQDERCRIVYSALTAEPYDCGRGVIKVTSVGSGRGGTSSKATIQQDKLDICKKNIEELSRSSSTSGSVVRQKAGDSEPCKSKNGDEKKDCITGFIAGYNNDNKTNTCTVANKDACEEGYEAGASVRPVTASNSEETDTDSNCSGGSMGWLFCPMIEYMANTINAVAGLIENLMEVRFTTAKGPVAQIEKAWRTFLSFANIALVIAFLIIIFSQATQAGLSNYNVKRMLPRLVVAAILMNISFYICVLAIDFSNIIGGSIMGLFLSDGDSISSSIGKLTNDGGGGLLGTTGAVAGAAILIGILIFVLPFVVLSIISVFIMLIGRQVVLMCLILVAPFAFVAWLLPNTEKYFQKWMQIFLQLLIVYPMIMLVFGASLFLSNLIGSDAGIGIIGG